MALTPDWDFFKINDARNFRGQEGSSRATQQRWFCRAGQHPSQSSRTFPRLPSRNRSRSRNHSTCRSSGQRESLKPSTQEHSLYRKPPVLLHWKSLHWPPTELLEAAVTTSGIFWHSNQQQPRHSLCLSKQERESALGCRREDKEVPRQGICSALPFTAWFSPPCPYS